MTSRNGNHSEHRERKQQKRNGRQGTETAEAAEGAEAATARREGGKGKGEQSSVAIEAGRAEGKQPWNRASAREVHEGSRSRPC